MLEGWYWKRASKKIHMFALRNWIFGIWNDPCRSFNNILWKLNKYEYLLYIGFHFGRPSFFQIHPQHFFSFFPLPFQFSRVQFLWPISLNYLQNHYLSRWIVIIKVQTPSNLQLWVKQQQQQHLEKIRGFF